MSEAVWWLLVALVFVIAEAFHRAFYAIFIAVGALVASVLAVSGVPVAVQIPAFVAAGALSMWLLRPMVKRAMSSGHYGFISGAQGLVGREAVVTRRVGDITSPGKIRIQGEEWTALSSDGNPIEPGKVVMILDLRDSKFIVEEMPELGSSSLTLPEAE